MNEKEDEEGGDDTGALSNENEVTCECDLFIRVNPVTDQKMSGLDTVTSKIYTLEALQKQ